MKKYTIEELQALPNDDLNALAAELRGHSIGTVLYAGKYSNWLLDATGNRIMYKSLWGPAVCRNQSGELLEWFVETQWRAHYTIRSGKLFRSVCVTVATDSGDVNVEANGTGAKAETVAFCAAMLAMKDQ